MIKKKKKKSQENESRHAYLLCMLKRIKLGTCGYGRSSPHPWSIEK